MSWSKPNPARERHWVCAQRLHTRRLAFGSTQLDVVARLQQRGTPATHRGVSGSYRTRWSDRGAGP